MALSFPNLSELRFLLSLDYPKPGSLFTWTTSHGIWEGWGWGRQCLDLLGACGKPCPLQLCQLPPLGRDSRDRKRTEVHGVWLPGQALLLHSSSGHIQQVCMTLEELLIICLGLPGSLTVENLICLSVAQIHYVVGRNLKFLFSTFLSVW